MAKESVLFVNSNYKPVLERLQSVYTVYNYRDAENRDALVAEAAKSVRAIFTMLISLRLPASEGRRQMVSSTPRY